MSLRFITPNKRGVLDLMVATALIVAAFALGPGASSPLSVWVSVATGAAVLVVAGLGLTKAPEAQGQTRTA